MAAGFVPETLGLVVEQVGEAGVVDVEDPGVEAVVGGGRDLVHVGGHLVHDAVQVPAVLATRHVARDVADARRRHGAPPPRVVGLHHDAPAQAPAVLRRRARPEARRLRPVGTAADAEGEENQEMRQQDKREQQPLRKQRHCWSHVPWPLHATTIERSKD